MEAKKVFLLEFGNKVRFVRDPQKLLFPNQTLPPPPPHLFNLHYPQLSPGYGQKS